MHTLQSETAQFRSPEISAYIPVRTGKFVIRESSAGFEYRYTVALLHETESGYAAAEA
jgi:hypothetical protein